MNGPGQVVGWVPNGGGTSRFVPRDRGRVMDERVDLEAAGWRRPGGVIAIGNRGWMPPRR
jgi:hypothetical protein